MLRYSRAKVDGGRQGNYRTHGDVGHSVIEYVSGNINKKKIYIYIFVFLVLINFIFLVLKSAYIYSP